VRPGGDSIWQGKSIVAALAQFAQPFDFSWLQQIGVLNGAIGRLLVACALGGLVGFEREVQHKAAGLRTNLLICMGSAFFTLLSGVLAGDAGSNRGQVASNIVQGIGFLGAGLILHDRSRVTGLTSAASVWVIASIGMACGAGLYAPAIAAALLVIFALEVIGFLEHRVNLKGYSLIYEARGSDQTQMLQSILEAMDKAGQRLFGVERDEIGGLQRITFSLLAPKKKHEQVRTQLANEAAITRLLTFRDPEED
jgi:putative Mg2+ transporter-C (MgtC) family protein